MNDRPAPPPRPDLYGPVHKALRLCMFDTLVRLGRVDGQQPDAVESAMSRLEQLFELLHLHQRLETEILHTAVEAHRPNGAQRAAVEHEEHLAAMALLAEQADALRRTPDRARMTMLYRHLARFVGEMLLHLQLEESTLTAALWAGYGDGPLRELQARLVAGCNEDQLGCLTHWLGAALGPHELAEWLAWLKGQVAPEVYARLAPGALAAAASAGGADATIV